MPAADTIGHVSLSVNAGSPPVPSPTVLPAAILTGLPFVAAHRGASGVRPEHTLDAYRTAIRMGADAIEIDVVPTKDGALVARHDPELGRTTDVADHPEFAGRRTLRTVDGKVLDGWFSEDFTLHEIKGLTARERIPNFRPANVVFDDLSGVPTLDEILGLLATESARAGRRIGLLLEVKHASHYDHFDVHLDQLLLAALRRHGVDHPGAGVAVMSFEPTVLRRLARQVSVPLVQIFERADKRPADLARAGAPTTYGDMLTPDWLDQIATYADVIAPHKSLVLPLLPDGTLGARGPVVSEARNRGLETWVWTLRAENHFLPGALRHGDDPVDRGDVRAEAAAYLDAGVTGLISDHPDLVLPAVRAMPRPA